MNGELLAFIRDKLQSLETALELLLKSGYDPKKIVKKALDDLKKAEELLKRTDVLSLDDYRSVRREERRRFPRIDLNVSVEWQKTDKAPKSLGIPAVSKDISAGGICLITKEKNIEVGDKWYLKLKLPKKKAIEAEGKVVWFSKIEAIRPEYENWHRVGIEFLAIGNEDKETIKKFVGKEKGPVEKE